MAKQQCETSVGLRSAEIQLLLSTRFVQLRPNVFIADGPNYVCLPCRRVSGNLVRLYVKDFKKSKTTKSRQVAVKAIHQMESFRIEIQLN